MNKTKLKELMGITVSDAECTATPEERESKIFCFSDEEETVSCRIITTPDRLADAKWFWEATVFFVEAESLHEDTEVALKEGGFTDEQIECLYEIFPEGPGTDMAAAYRSLADTFCNMGIANMNVTETDLPDLFVDYGGED